MKTKGLIFVSCLAAGALIASPAMGKPAKKSSVSKSKRMAPQTTQVKRNYRHNQNISLARAAPATTAEPVTVVRALTRAGNTARVTAAAPAIMVAVITTTTTVYTPTYGYNASMVAAVQRRLGQLGYYHGVVDGVIGPQTRSAIAAFESRNGIAVDGTISRPLLDSLGLA